MRTKKQLTRKRNYRRIKTFSTNWNQEEFFEHCEINLEVVAEAKLTWEELANIYEDHCSKTQKLDTVAKYIAERLRGIPKIHSVRARVKDSRNLVRKIIRKRIEDKSRNIGIENYQQDITDLIGIRALHLYKEDWLEIHNFIEKEWDTIEIPTAYIREGDNPEWTKSYKENGCDVKPHPRKYRSIHYLVNCSPSKNPNIAELQVRTLFEEAWSEIDHQVNYPQAVPHNIVAYYLELFNRYAGSADEMGSLLRSLVTELHRRDLQSEQIVSERDEALRKVEELLKTVEMGEVERTELEKELRKLRTTPTSSSVWYGETGITIGNNPDSSVISFAPEVSNSYISLISRIRCINCSKEIALGEKLFSGRCANCNNIYDGLGRTNITFGAS